MMSIGIVSQPELQNLAAAVVLLLWLAARHRSPNTAFFILNRPGAIRVPAT
jgi:hypothetical protein